MKEEQRIKIIDKFIRFFDDWTYVSIDFDSYPITGAQLYVIDDREVLVVEWGGDRRTVVRVARDEGFCEMEHQFYHQGRWSWRHPYYGCSTSEYITSLDAKEVLRVIVNAYP